MRRVVLVVDDEAHVAAGVAQLVSDLGFDAVVCQDIESAELAAEAFDLTAVVSDVRLTGPFRFEGLDYLEHIARQARSARVILMSGAVTGELRAEGKRRGAVAVLQKPMDFATLRDAIGGSEDGQGNILIVPTLDQILHPRQLHTRFQRVVDLASERSIGFESLARPNTSSFLANPTVLFAYAARKKRVADLEFACMTSTFEAAGPLIERGLLFLNLHPAVLSDPRFESFVTTTMARANVPLTSVVFELTEQDQTSVACLPLIARLRERGARFAFDDVGIAYSHLAHIGEIRPAFLKVSQQFGTDFERDETRHKLVSNLRSLAAEFNARLILEGIESDETAAAARELGIALGQGYHFGAPAAVETLVFDAELPQAGASPSRVVPDGRP